MKTLCFVLLLSAFQSLGQSGSMAFVDEPAFLHKDKPVNYSSSYKLESSTLIKDHLSAQFEYPDKLVENGVEGIVVIKVSISEKGKVREVEILQSPHRELEAEVIRFLKGSGQLKLSPYYEPYDIYIPVHFKLTPF